MSATEFRELAVKARNEKRAKLGPKFQVLLAEAQKEAEKGLYAKDFPGTLDPLLVKMFEERQFRVESVNTEGGSCTSCMMVEHVHRLNPGAPAACEAHISGCVTRISWAPPVELEE
jgi:hypothetical protein